jgi:hypothetical protein
VTDLAFAYTLHIDGNLIPVTNLFDEFGDEVIAWEDADRFVAGPLPDGNWLMDFTSKYSTNARH